jgi:hypothetical protein
MSPKRVARDYTAKEPTRQTDHTLGKGNILERDRSQTCVTPRQDCRKSMQEIRYEQAVDV